MGLGRREFLSCTAGALTVGLRVRDWSASAVETTPGCVFLDLKEHCCLGESVAGYETALASFGLRWMHADAWSVSRCAVLIVPAALEISPPEVEAIASCIEAGASVILESGTAFAQKKEFRAHRDVLRDSLQVRIEAPVRLWPAHSSSRGIPYVDYTWPSRAKVRDFSSVVPLADRADGGEIIAWVDGLPVALKRRRGRGTLIFLGSPLGTALWAGDTEARRWFSDVLRQRIP
jgi:hypothetical protein